MALTAEPVAQLANLPNADGSATYTYQGYTVTSSVNGPIEAPRRDESAFEANVDVIVRPAAGVGGEHFSRARILICASFQHSAMRSRLHMSSKWFLTCILGTAERQLESILQSALRQLIPIRNFPRCMIQITLQIVSTPENSYENAKIVQAQLVRRPPKQTSSPFSQNSSNAT